MLRRYQITLIVLVFTCLCKFSFSQIKSFNIATQTVTECRANFYDDGGPTGNYTFKTSNAPTDYTFCIYAKSAITLTFASTAIDFGDILTFYNGANSGAPMINGPYTNIFTPIPPIFAPSGSLTIVWHEDGSSVKAGWVAGWTASVTPPITPSIAMSPTANCGSTTLTLNLTNGVTCDSVKAKYFIVTGPMFPGVTSATPISCSSTLNGTTTAIKLTLTNPLSKNCSYTVNSTVFILANCDSVFKYPNILNTFSVSNCPITASINAQPSNTICQNQCCTLTAVPEASCLNFTYLWSTGATVIGPVVVCPTITTVYSCTITETSSLAQAVITKTVYVLSPAITALASNSVCQSAGQFNFSATPAGGAWSGPGITNTLTGTFNPYVSGPGTFTVKYTIGNCYDQYTITVLAINAGSDDAACLGGPSFTVTGGLPTGGTWTSLPPNVTPSGVFTPTAVGNYTLTYSIGPCTQTKMVYVNTLSLTTNNYSICMSQWYTYLGFMVSPPGGRFYGNGIINSVAGQFSATAAGAGQSVITYSLANGCQTNFTVFVWPIYATPVATTCPSHVPFLVPAATPTGGIWSGTGITNGPLGMYNPSIGGLNTHTDVLIYTDATSGCEDTTVMCAIRTDIAKDSLFFCDNNDSVAVSDYNYLNYTPSFGNWTGPSIVFQNGFYYFKPKVAGVGVHTVYYDINTCKDSIKMVVYPSKLPGHDSTVCSTHPPFIVAPMPPGTVWGGIGITNTSTGLFDPGSVGTGTFNVWYTNKGGCTDTVQIAVYNYQAANISGLVSTYCYKNLDIVFGTSPAGGTLTATGGVNSNTFNPSVAGQGTFKLKYVFGTGICYTADSITIKVYPQLTTTTAISAQTVCLGTSSSFTVGASGGLPTVTQFTYSWSHNLLSLNHQQVVPGTTTVYTVVSTDGCSDPVTDTFRVYVVPQFYPSLTTSTLMCYGKPGFATVSVTPTGNYSYSWNTTPVQTSPTVNGIAGRFYQVHIKNIGTGCSRDTSVDLPGYKPIKAGFSPNPNLSCVPFSENLITFIDLSNGADSGYWNFNGAIVAYTPGINPQYRFDNPGSFNVTLQVYNKGLCPDMKTFSICILESNEVFIPDIFSPNGDGSNDVLYVRGGAIKEIKFMLYDRWGEKVFETHDVNIGWDGTYKGKPVDPAVYAYYTEYTTGDDKKVVQKGDITLIR